MLRLAGFPHSEILGSKPAYRLPEAYRRLLRPSSAPDAKASTVCSSKLDHIHELNRARAASRPGMTNGLNKFRIIAFSDPTLHASDRRCSRPLCSSQHTVGAPCRRIRKDPPFRGPRKPAPGTHVPAPIPQDPTACTPAEPEQSPAVQTRGSYWPAASAAC